MQCVVLYTASIYGSKLGTVPVQFHSTCTVTFTEHTIFMADAPILVFMSLGFFHSLPF